MAGRGTRRSTQKSWNRSSRVSAGWTKRLRWRVAVGSAAAPADPGPAQTLDLHQPQQLQAVGLLPGFAHIASTSKLGEVEERASDGRDRNPAFHRFVLGGHSAAMQADSFPAESSLAPRACVDVDQAPVPPHRQAALSWLRKGALSAGQHGRKPPSSPVDTAVSNRERFAMEGVEPPAPSHRLDPPLQNPAGAADGAPRPRAVQLASSPILRSRSTRFVTFDATSSP